MKIELTEVEALTIMRKHLETEYPGATISNLTINKAPVRLEDVSIIDEIDHTTRDDKAYMITRVRRWAESNGVSFGLAFAKRLVELNPALK